MDSLADIKTDLIEVLLQTLQMDNEAACHEWLEALDCSPSLLEYGILKRFTQCKKSWRLSAVHLNVILKF